MPFAACPLSDLLRLYMRSLAGPLKPAHRKLTKDHGGGGQLLNTFHRCSRLGRTFRRPVPLKSRWV